MQPNALPHYDDSDNPTGCCPRFNPEGWDGQELHFENKEFIRATTKSAMHIPLNMGRVFERINTKMMETEAYDSDNCIVLSRDLSAWQAEHLFATSASVPDEESVTLTGDYITKVFEGPYREAKDWYEQMQTLAGEKGAKNDEVYFFYTTCPKCAKAYGKNYVVGVARVA
ncbi:MAG: hypothetical protein HKN30_00315 [Sulfitobacter sp.]|nr:hypothetical protein [Sulfitobacter sp.]